MLFHIVIGSLLICLCVVIHAAIIGFVSTRLSNIGEWLITGNPFYKLSLSLSMVTLTMLLSLSIAVWLWASLFIGLGIFDTLETALYFSIVTFTTLGFGDILIENEWRLLSGFLATNGLIMFSLTTAFLLEFMMRMNKAQQALKDQGKTE